MSKFPTPRPLNKLQALIVQGYTGVHTGVSPNAYVAFVRKRLGMPHLPVYRIDQSDMRLKLRNALNADFIAMCQTQKGKK